MTGLAFTAAEAEELLGQLAAVFTRDPPGMASQASAGEPDRPNLEAMYRTLVEQIPAVVFMAYLDRGIGEAYVSPRIESALGFSQAEWLQDPVRWYQQIHPDDQQRWSIEAADMFVTGRPLRSSYRVLARDGRVIWFHCEAKMVRRADGQPWLIHGVGFDISELKEVEGALAGERNLLSAVLDTVGALVLLLDPAGRILRSNRAFEELTGYSSAEVRGRSLWELLPVADEAERFRRLVAALGTGGRREQEADWLTRDGATRRIAWSASATPAAGAAPAHIIATGTDITERKRMERATLEMTGEVQRRIGTDLHDGLGQHLTGIAFMGKVLEQRLADSAEDAAAARKIVNLVNEAIHTTRELARGLLPVVTEADGLMAALQRWAGEMEQVFRLPCRFECPEPVLVADVTVATHLYHIAQEAVSNAVRHASPSVIVVSLTHSDDTGTLAIEDDGAGLPEPAPGDGGLGLRIMRHRAGLIGGALDLSRSTGGGTIVSCRFPLPSEESGA